MATLETLLCIEAMDKLDRHNRITPVNRELIAQGIGNFLCGILGAIPITAVVVRGSANIEAGAKTKVSAFMHGVFLLLSVLFVISVLVSVFSVLPGTSVFCSVFSILFSISLFLLTPIKEFILL